jgi:hypothetical protein
MFWIQGWIEVTNYIDSEQDGKHAWMSLFNLGTLIDSSDHISEQLFGLSKRIISGEFESKSYFANRGLPSNPSSEVQIEISSIDKLEIKYGSGEFGAYTHALWSEIKSIKFDKEILDKSDWKLVFDLVDRIETDRRYFDNQIRFIVWYNW